MTMRAWQAVVAALWVLLLGSSLAVVYGKHAARNQFTELQNLTGERDQLAIEWGQLQLEQSTWGTHGRVERLARDDLHMVIPRPSELRIVKP